MVVVGRGETWPSVGLCLTPNTCFFSLAAVSGRVRGGHPLWALLAAHRPPRCPFLSSGHALTSDAPQAPCSVAPSDLACSQVCVCTLTWLSVQAGRPPRLAPSQGHPGRCGASSSTPHPGSLGPAGGRGAREHTDASSSLRHGFTLSSVTALPFSTVRWSSSPCSTET